MGSFTSILFKVNNLLTASNSFLPKLNLDIKAKTAAAQVTNKAPIRLGKAIYVPTWIGR